MENRKVLSVGLLPTFSPLIEPSIKHGRATPDAKLSHRRLFSSSLNQVISLDDKL